jgi:hypothetical protein
VTYNFVTPLTIPSKDFDQRNHQSLKMYNQCDHEDGNEIALIFYLFLTRKYHVRDVVIKKRDKLICAIMRCLQDRLDNSFFKMHIYYS